MSRHAAIRGVRGAALVGLMLAGPAAAADPAAIINCWDRSFAYTLVGLREDPAGLHVRLSSQNEIIFRPLAPGAVLDWGLGRFDVVFARDGCTVDPVAKHFSCSADAVEARLHIGARWRDDKIEIVQTWDRLSVELMSIVTAAGADPDGGEPRLLLINGEIDGQPRTLVERFAYGSECSDWPDAFSEP